MELITTVEEMQTISSGIKAAGETIGFVPTMGYLHEGHLSLIKHAREENSKVIISIFVNPLQFGPNEDFETYPRDLERDKKLAEEAGADYIFHPSAEEMYPDKMTIEIKVKERTNVLCGRKRAGHFDGVATVLVKLFSIIQPNHAYFGLKDAQQVAVVDGLIHDFNLPIKLKAIPTVREADGLAKSSRNVYLSDKEREQAKQLYQSLLLAKKLIESGERIPETIIAKMTAYLQENTDGIIDYIEIYSYPNLEELHELAGKIIIAIAVKFSKARLIDNIILDI